MLPAARQVSSYLQTDDTSARRQGKNGHTLHIGNQWFAALFSSESKSRVNFLEVLRQPFDDYLVGGDALFYMKVHGLPQYLLEKIGRGWPSTNAGSGSAGMPGSGNCVPGRSPRRNIAESLPKERCLAA